MSSPSRSMLLIISFMSQYIASVFAGGKCSKNEKQMEILQFAALKTKGKLLGNNSLHHIGEYMGAESVQKMKQTSKHFANVKIYENIFPNERDVAVFKNVKTGQIIWEMTEFKSSWFRIPTIPNLGKLVSLLRRNTSSKWNDVFLWFVENWHTVTQDFQFVKTEFRNNAILKKLMLSVAENVAVDFTDSRYVCMPFARTPMMIAAIFDASDAILTLIERNADVNERDGFYNTPYHIAAYYGNINTCTTLLEKGANKGLTNNEGKTALQFAQNSPFASNLLKFWANEPF